MLEDLADRIGKLLPSHLTLIKLHLRETLTSYAEWHLEDNQS